MYVQYVVHSINCFEIVLQSAERQLMKVAAPCGGRQYTRSYIDQAGTVCGAVDGDTPYIQGKQALCY